MLRIIPVTGFSIKTKYSERRDCSHKGQRGILVSLKKKLYILNKITGFFSAFHWHLLYY